MARYPYREVIELYSTGLSIEKVAYLCGVGICKAGDVLGAARRLGIGWPVPAELGDEELERLVDPLEGARRCRPDFPAIAKALGTERLRPKQAQEAYDLYLEMSRGSEKEPYAFWTFKKHMGRWNSTRKARPSMLINWHPGEEVQVDWAGRKLWLHGSDGKKAPAFLFVATLPYSDLTFVRASLDMGMQTWLEHHMRMFEYLGGVPIFIGVDNLATGVTFHKDGSKTVHRHYKDLADHYGAIVVPTRTYTPTDKESVEGHVRIMANAIMGILEGMRFQTIEQLNDAIAALLETFNDRPSSALHDVSRREAFEAWERGALKPLPAEPYAPVIWKRYVADQGGVLRVRGNYYGLPGCREGEKVWARISKTRVDVYDARKAQMLATHPRRMDGEETFEGLPGTCPDRFRPLADWAQANGRTLLVKQWDAERNEGMSPGRVVCRSKKKVWWCCPECGYGWREAVVARMKRKFDDCPRCAGLVLVKGVNDLGTTHPHIASEWDDDRNPLAADEVFPDWRMRVWWKGECGHSWCAPVVRRTSSSKGALCPYCSGREALAGFNDVATLAPDLAARWHPVKNRNDTPETTSVLSNRNVYLWDGPLTEIRRASVRSQIDEACLETMVEAGPGLEEQHSSGAHLNQSRTILKWRIFYERAGLAGMSLRQWCERFCHQELTEQWDDEMNAPLTPDDVSPADQRRVWWTDASCGHTWLASVRGRAYDGTECLYCDRRRVLLGYSSLGSTSTQAAKNWHPTKNGSMTLDTVTDRTSGLAWWRCPDCGHEWSECLSSGGDLAHACPICRRRPFFLRPGENDLLRKHPAVAELFAEDLNEGVDVATLFDSSKKRYWWRCKHGHVWEARVDTMVKFRRRERCPYCSGRKLLAGFNDIETLAPEAAALWHPTRNGDLRPSDVTAVTSRLIWWKCGCGHEWQATGRDVAKKGNRCPRCANRVVVTGDNDLATLEPALSEQWHPTRNGGLRPTDVARGSNKRVWWRCSEGHDWQQTVNDRTRSGAGCPICAGRLLSVGDNDLATTHPGLASQWAEDLNGELGPTDVTAISIRSVWWRCELGHTWRLRVRQRVIHDAGCPYCNNRKVLRGFNDLATVRPDMAAQWYYEGNWPMKPTDVTAISTKQVRWKMECGHVFRLTVGQRARNKRLTCPVCTGHIKVECPLNWT